MSDINKPSTPQSGSTTVALEVAARRKAHGPFTGSSKEELDVWFDKLSDALDRGFMDGLLKSSPKEFGLL